MAVKKRTRTTKPSVCELPSKFTVEGFSTHLTELGVKTDLHMKEAPSCVNFMVLHRWRVTAELIEEPKEVLGQRLIELWERTESNQHHDLAFKHLAEKFGVTLERSRRGIRCKGRSR